MEQPGLSRTLSGRDKIRAQATHIAIRSAPPAIRGQSDRKSYHLVVFGAINPAADGFIWADWFAICTYLINKGVAGTFLSIKGFLDDHFDELSLNNQHDIKFGMTGVNKEPILTYTRMDYAGEDQYRWWEDVSKENMKSRVISWLRDTARKAQPGDSVNFVFESHGHAIKGLRLGSQFLDDVEFARELEAFSPGVQVNAISGACYSGRFLERIQARNQHDRYIAVACGSKQAAFSGSRSISNRFRNSRYEQAWIQSLAKLQISSDAPEDQLTSTVEEHEHYIRENIHRCFDPVTQDPEHYVSTDLTLEMAVEDLLFRDKIDVLHDPTITSRRRRIEWPSGGDTLLNTLKKTAEQPETPTASAKSDAISLIEDELSHCKAYRDAVMPCDVGVHSQYPSDNDRNIGDLLKVLYYRGRVQSTLLDIFMMLVQRGFLSLENLRKHLTISTTSETCGQINFLLSSFQMVSTEMDYENHGNGPHRLWDYGSTYEAVDWLSAMIVRGCADAGKLFQTIQLSGYLGGVVDKDFEEYLERFPGITKFDCNPEERACDGVGTPRIFGFWLPHGMGDIHEAAIHIEIANCISRFDRIERVFKAYFKIPDTMLLTSELQASFLEVHPERCPSNALKAYLQRSRQYRKASEARSLSRGMSAISA